MLNSSNSSTDTGGALLFNLGLGASPGLISSLCTCFKTSNNDGTTASTVSPSSSTVTTGFPPNITPNAGFFDLFLNRAFLSSVIPPLANDINPPPAASAKIPTCSSISICSLGF